MTALVLLAEQALGSALDLTETAQRAEDLARQSRSDATRRAYASDWRHFTQWCEERGLAVLPAVPVTVGLYLAAHADTLTVATLTRRLSAISTVHRLAGHHLPTRHPAIRDVLGGLRREKGSAPRRSEAMTTPLLINIVSKCDPGRLIDLRDRALLLVGFAAALRRSEIVALDLADITITPQGLRIALRRSKGDQEGQGDVLPVMRTGNASCPVLAFEDWIAAAVLTDGKAFRSVNRHGKVGESLSGHAVALIVKRRADLAGMADSNNYAGHSLRSGFATAAAERGIEERVIARQTRHKSLTVLRTYIREGELFRRNLAADIGL